MSTDHKASYAKSDLKPGLEVLVDTGDEDAWVEVKQLGRLYFTVKHDPRSMCPTGVFFYEQIKAVGDPDTHYCS